MVTFSLLCAAGLLPSTTPRAELSGGQAKINQAKRLAEPP
jgi:hypothetical protein